MKKYNIIVSIVIFAIVFALGCIFLAVWFGGHGDKYGDRLNGIEEVEISKNKLNDIASKIKEKEFVKKVDSNIQGRIINILVTVEEKANVNNAKGVSSIVIDTLSEKELSFYDIQLFLLEENSSEDSNYPYIGYKHKSVDTFTWSNN